MFFRKKEKLDRDPLQKKKTITKLQKPEEFDKGSALKQVYFDEQQVKLIEDDPQFLNNILDHYETTSSGSTVDDVRNDIESGQFRYIAGVYMDQDLIENAIRLMLDLEIITEATN